MARLDDDEADESTPGPPDADRVSAPFDLTLLPAGVVAADLDALAAEFGTPLFVYDEDELRARAGSTSTASVRTTSCTRARRSCAAMARLVAEEGLHLDVATGGELHVALRAGFPPSASCSTATTSPTTSSRPRCDAGVGRIVVDSFDELDRLEARALTAVPGARAGHARGRGAHPRVHRDRHRRFEVRVHVATGARRGRRRARGRRPRRCVSAASTATSARRCSGSTRSRGRRASSARFAAECERATGVEIAR